MLGISHVSGWGDTLLCFALPAGLAAVLYGSWQLVSCALTSWAG